MKDWWQREKWMDKVGAQRENLDKQEQQDLKRLNKIAIQAIPQMAVDKRTLSRVHKYYS